MRQLNDPFQLNLMFAHVRMATRVFPIATRHAACVHHFTRAEMSIDSYADVIGVSAQAVRDDMEAVTRGVQKFQKKIRTRRQPASAGRHARKRAPEHVTDRRTPRDNY